jgi:hypothetical protein
LSLVLIQWRRRGWATAHSLAPVGASRASHCTCIIGITVSPCIVAVVWSLLFGFSRLKFRMNFSSHLFVLYVSPVCSAFLVRFVKNDKFCKFLDTFLRPYVASCLGPNIFPELCSQTTFIFVLLLVREIVLLIKSSAYICSCVSLCFRTFR